MIYFRYFNTSHYLLVFRRHLFVIKTIEDTAKCLVIASVQDRKMQHSLKPVFQSIVSQYADTPKLHAVAQTQCVVYNRVIPQTITVSHSAMHCKKKRKMQSFKL